MNLNKKLLAEFQNVRFNNIEKQEAHNFISESFKDKGIRMFFNLLSLQDLIGIYNTTKVKNSNKVKLIAILKQQIEIKRKINSSKYKS